MGGKRRCVGGRANAGDVAATATFDCAGLYIDTYQLVKLDGEWRIANKFFTNQ